MDEKRGLMLKGRMSLRLYKEDGSVVAIDKDNLIVTAGLDFIANIMGATSPPTKMTHIGVGTSSTAPNAAQTDLLAPTMRKAATYSHTGGTLIFSFTTTFNAGEATAALTEAGVFNASSGGIMLDRVTFAVVNKGANDTLTVTFTFTMSQT